MTSTTTPIPPFVEALINAPVRVGSCKLSAGQQMAQFFKKLFGNKPVGGTTQQMKEYYYRLVLTAVVILAGLILIVLLVLSLTFFILIQNAVNKRNKKTADAFKRDSVRPYKDTLEYKVLNASIIAPYKVIFYLTAVAVSILILGVLITIEMESKNPKGTTYDEPWYSKWNSRFLLIFIVLFLLCLYFIEIKYYKKVAEFYNKITELNTTIRAMLPANMGFLTAISTAPKAGDPVELILKQAMLNLKTNENEIARGICIMNLYYYYFENYKTSLADLETVLACFTPINKILSGDSKNCFTNYLINNNSYISNKIGDFISYLQDSTFDTSPLRDFVNRNRSKIMLKTSQLMNTINKQSACLGSAYAFNLYIRMSKAVFLSVWSVTILIVVLFLYFGGKTDTAAPGPVCSR